MEVIDRFVFLLFICICAAVLMVTFIDETSKYMPITLLALMVVVVLHTIYQFCRLTSDLPELKPTKLFARFSNGLGSLKRLDSITLAWMIGILALCLLAMRFVSL